MRTLSLLACLIALVGCYGPMYQPNGYPPAGAYPQGGYPPGYPGPGYQTLTPGTQQYAPGVGAPSTYGGQSPGLTPIPENGSSAPPYSPPGADSRVVPDPNDPSARAPAGNESAFNAPVYNETARRADFPETAAADPLDTLGSEVSPASAEPGQFSEPVPTDESMNLQPIEPADPGSDADLFNDGMGATSNRPTSTVAFRPYAYDSDYAWLQGELAYDGQDRTWSILYSDSPSDDDPYQGCLTLAGDQRFQRLRSGDVVRVQGTVDPVVRDTRGKKTYVATEVTLLQPSK